jgi:hypothetical protein
MRPPAFASTGRWFRGNLHTHSNRSDGVAPPEQVIAEYRAAGYDFLVLTDHFEARWGWTVTDTAAARDESFTTLLGVELSSADWDDEDVFWVNAIGLAADIRGPAPDEPHAALIHRAAQDGAYNVLLHPGLTNLLDFDRLPGRTFTQSRPTTSTPRTRGPIRQRDAMPWTRCWPGITACTSPSGTTRIGFTDGIDSGLGSRSEPSTLIQRRCCGRCTRARTTPHKVPASTTSASKATACTSRAALPGPSR